MFPVCFGQALHGIVIKRHRQKQMWRRRVLPHVAKRLFDLCDGCRSAEDDRRLPQLPDAVRK